MPPQPIQEPAQTRDLERLQALADALRIDTIRMTTQAGSGHPSSGASMAEITCALYFGGVLRYRPQEPGWPGRDRFILSKGHACPYLYAVLAEASYFPRDWLWTLRELGSPLEGHPNMLRLPGIEASTGSLGQGLSIGLGHALNARLDGLDYRVYVLIGDGESDEGQVWEAAAAAAKYQVDNLTCILDANRFQQTGPVMEVMPMEPYLKKWQAFGWQAFEIDGHDYQAVFGALDEVRRVRGKPQVVVARTEKGHRMKAAMENETNRKHGEPLTEEEAERAIAELEA